MTLPCLLNVDSQQRYQGFAKSAEDSQVIQEVEEISTEERETEELQRRVKTCKNDIALMENDIGQINLPTVQQAFQSTKKKFTEFETQVKQASLQCSKKVSLASNVEAETAVFATRARFLRVLLEGCEKYRKTLLEILHHPTSEGFKPKRRTLTDKGKMILAKWFEDHRAHPFPTSSEKEMLAHQVGAPVEQISTWFINARARKGKVNINRKEVDQDKQCNNKKQRTTEIETESENE